MNNMTLTRKQFDILVCAEKNKAPMTQREIAQKLGISRSYVSRIEKGAIDKLREGFGLDRA